MLNLALVASLSESNVAASRMTRRTEDVQRRNEGSRNRKSSVQPIGFLETVRGVGSRLTKVAVPDLLKFEQVRDLRTLVDPGRGGRWSKVAKSSRIAGGLGGLGHAGLADLADLYWRT
eukprot:gene14276-biopygen146